MPFYEIQHSHSFSTPQKSHLAQSLTALHSKTFNAPSLFVNIKFTDISNECYFIGGQERKNSNRIFAHVRGGKTRTGEVLAELAREVEGLWYEIVGTDDEGGKGKGERELSAVFIVPGLVAREKGFAIPEAGNEGAWLEENMPEFEKRALQGDEDMKGLVEEVSRRPELRGK